MVPDLAKLEEKYREAQAAYANDDSDINKKAFKRAKLAFSNARAKQRDVAIGRNPVPTMAGGANLNGSGEK